MLHIPGRRIAALAMMLSASLAVLPDPAFAQQPVSQPDSVQGDSLEMRLEPTYVVSTHGLLWSCRVQYDFYLPGTPFVAGFSGVGKSYPLTSGHPRHDHPRKSLYVGAVTVIFGVRF